MPCSPEVTIGTMVPASDIAYVVHPLPSEWGVMLRLAMDVHDEQTDLTSHHIEGYAAVAPDLGYFSTPLISEIEENLWMGGCIDGLKLPDDFRFVLSLYPWGKYRLPEGCERVEVALRDSADVPPTEQIDDLALLVNRKRMKGKTLVHCQAGLNRSGLIVARALTFSGRSAKTAVEEVRAKRCAHVLCNPAFEDFLLGNHQ